MRVRAALLSRVLDTFRQSFPEEREVYLLRTPGRINLMGVHIDHQGGWSNHMAIARETLFCFSPRADGTLRAKNCSPEYPDREFSIAHELPDSARGRWLEFIETSRLPRGDWGNYLKAGALKLQDHFRQIPIRGMNAVVGGDIPPKAGLSSSSTLVVSVVKALEAVNGLSLPPQQGVELCGEAEWYVGTRGGSGDHAAILLSHAGSVTHVGFKPLRVEYCPFPPDYSVIFCSSGIEAAKAGTARETFNHRIAAYQTAFLLYRHLHPQKRERLLHLRDISPDNLDMPLWEFYTSMQSIPITAHLHELRNHYPELKGELERIISIYGEPAEGLPLREVLLFGVGECDRAKQFPKYLQQGEIAKAGELMYISHDGDRVSEWIADRSRPYRSPYQNEYLVRLAEAAARSPEVERLSPAFQPGGYRCSVPEMDRVVDYCKTLPGVLGAGLTGAGMGGAVLVLVRAEQSTQVVAKLRELVSLWRPGEPQVEICRPVEGASFLPSDPVSR